MQRVGMPYAVPERREAELWTAAENLSREVTAAEKRLKAVIEEWGRMYGELKAARREARMHAELHRADLFVPAPGSGIPLPDYLAGIYERGRWEDYDRQKGYRKAPCMIRLRSGKERGPCWPNAGKFCEFHGQGEWAERLVVAVAYYVPAEDSPNESSSATGAERKGES